jgi:DNA recombination protein RmuC
MSRAVAAILTAFQAGCRTLAIRKRSDEVWTTLGKVKVEFGEFAGVLEKVQKKLAEAGETIDDAHVRTRSIERSLRGVEALPAPPGHEILAAAGGEEDGGLIALPAAADPLQT